MRGADGNDGPGIKTGLAPATGEPAVSKPKEIDS
jgi:hypothetical protein